jgi:hypothetical protein
MTRQVVVILIVVLFFRQPAASVVAVTKGIFEQRRGVDCCDDATAFGADNAARADADHLGTAACSEQRGGQLFGQSRLGVGIRLKSEDTKDCREKKKLVILSPAGTILLS